MRSLLTLILCFPLTLFAEESAKAKPVTLTPLAELRIQLQHSAPAVVIALNRSRLSSEINAKINTIHVKVGDRVETGSPLVSFDCRDHRSRLIQQKAEIQRLKSQEKQAINRLQRAQNLKTDSNISLERLESRETELTALKAQLSAQLETVAQHQRNVERCILKAPYSGQVEARLSSEGELAAPGTPLIEFLQLNEAEVEAEIRPQRVEQLNKAKLAFRYLNKDLPLKLARHSASLNLKTRTQKVRFTFLDKQAPTGAAGRLIWTDPTPHVPADYIQQRNGKLGLFIADKGNAIFHPVAGTMEGRPSPIELSGEAIIIDQGRHGLKHGDQITTADQKHTEK